jgi:hypothetical protein
MPRTMTNTAQVEAYLADLDHPHKAALVALRAIILGASDKIAERIKWKVPSFYYKDNPKHDLAAFHPRTTEAAHLVLVFPLGLVPDPAGLLEGDWPDRRMAKFRSLAAVQANQTALAAIVNAWVQLEEHAR